MRKLIEALFPLAFTFGLAQTVDASSTLELRASGGGAKLDSNLLTGGGTDDTIRLQRILDHAADGTPLHLVVDGPALVGGLDVYGNTTVECTMGGGFFLKDGALRAVLRNAHRSRTQVIDEHIEVRNCFINGNRSNQLTPNVVRPDFPSAPPAPSNKERDGTYLSGLQFLGVHDLLLTGITVWNTRAFGVLIANAKRVSIRDITIDHGGQPDADISTYVNTDGLHFKGPLQYVSIDSARIRVGDDSLAFNANDYETDDITRRNDFGPYVGQGPITDVSVSNIQLMDSLDGIRILSTKERIDRLSIANVTGTVRLYFLYVTHFLNPTSMGNVGSITVSNVMVDRPAAPDVSKVQMIAARANRVFFGEFNGENFPLVGVNAHIDSLRLNSISTRIGDRRPIIRIGPDAAVDSMHVDLTAVDPLRLASIFEIEQGGLVRMLKFGLDWSGNDRDSARNPITMRGGEISSLEWISTPPLFVRGRWHRSDSRIVIVEFTQQLQSRLPESGAIIKVNGKDAKLLRARFGEDSRSIRYELSSTLREGDFVSWSYDAHKGNLRNRSGDPLQSVSAKEVVPDDLGESAASNSVGANRP